MSATHHEQRGWAVVSDTPVGQWTHRFVTTEWEAERELRAVRRLSSEVVRNPRLARAVLLVEDAP